MSATSYDETFYDSHRVGAERSANRILPLVFNWIPTRTVIDVGCGQGAWLSVVRDMGIMDVVGVDGSYIDRQALRIPQDCFVEADLSQSLPVERAFDLALCLEVAEHLPTERNEIFLDKLTSLSPAILFSASLPYQNGTQHVNEQWLEFWVERFAQRGYIAVDCIRSAVWHDPDVRWWYAQNCMLYVDKNKLHHYPKLAKHLGETVSYPYTFIHPNFFLYKEARTLERMPLKQILGEARKRLRQKFSCRPVRRDKLVPPPKSVTQPDNLDSSVQ